VLIINSFTCKILPKRTTSARRPIMAIKQDWIGGVLGAFLVLCIIFAQTIGGLLELAFFFEGITGYQTLWLEAGLLTILLIVLRRRRIRIDKAVRAEVKTYRIKKPEHMTESAAWLMLYHIVRTGAHINHTHIRVQFGVALMGINVVKSLLVKNEPSYGYSLYCNIFPDVALSIREITVTVVINERQRHVTFKAHPGKSDVRGLFVPEAYRHFYLTD
jgi:hypothetical protein